MAVNSSLPNKATYGAMDILAPNVSWWNNRSEYLAATGTQAAPFVAGQPVKRWAVTGLDLSQASAQYTFNYLGLDSGGNPAMLSMTLPAVVAAAVNMPGMMSFPSYASWLASRAPTKGTVEYKFFGNDFVNPMDVSALFMPEEAKALAAELSQQLGMTLTAVALTTPDGNATAVYNYDPADPRRIFDINVAVGPGKDQMFAMGSATGLFAVRSSVGVGAPGTWSWTLNLDGTPEKPATNNYAAGPRWTATVPADGATEAREYPVPVRALVSPPEKLVGLFGSVVAVERTDLVPDAPTSGSGGGLTDAQTSVLADIQSKVTAMWKTLPSSAQ
jgi:hypothetical protein